MKNFLSNEEMIAFKLQRDESMQRYMEYYLNYPVEDSEKNEIIENVNDRFIKIFRAMDIAYEVGDLTNYLRLIEKFILNVHVGKLGSYWSECVFYLRIAIHSSKNHPQLNRFSNALIKQLGFILVDQGNYNEAFPLFNKILKQANIENNKEELCVSLHEIGIILSSLNEYSEAIMFIKSSLRLAKDLNDERNISVNYLELGNIHSAMNKDEIALKYYNVAYKIFQKLNLKYELTMVINGIANIESRRNNIDKSEELFNECLSIYFELNNFPGVARILYKLGGIYISKGQLLLAKETITKSLKIYENFNTPLMIALNLRSLGRIELLENNIEAAVTFFLRAIELKESINFVRGLTKDYYEIALSYFQTRQLDECYKFLEKSIFLSKKVNEKFHTGIALSFSAQISFFIYGNKEKGLKEMEESIEIFKSLKHNNELPAREILEEMLEINSTSEEIKEILIIILSSNPNNITQ